MLELDPDSGTDRRDREETGLTAAERQARYRPAAFVIPGHVRHSGPDPTEHQWVLVVAHDPSVLAKKIATLTAHGRTKGSRAPVPSRLQLNCCVYPPCTLIL